MTDSALWLKGIDLASIATSLMVISVAVLLYVSRTPKQYKSSPRSSKK